MTLDELKVGQTAIIKRVGGEGALRQHFLDMGVIPSAKVKLVKLAPFGDPMELLIHGYNLSLRKEDAVKIEITDPFYETTIEEIDVQGRYHSYVEHPGIGETGRFHSRIGENPLPKGETIKVALVGNQNCGKTTLFNQLTGMNQHVGNFPGVTVERKSGIIKGYPNTIVTDLPGIYSLSPYSSEEIVSRNFILNENPNVLINIVDASNIERNLYLSMQLMELDVPMVLALNMMDEVRSNGGHIHINDMESMLGIPVIPISAIKNEGIGELIEHAVHIAQYQEKPKRLDFCDKNEYGGAVHRCLHGIMHLIEDHAVAARIPLRFAAGKVIEGDKLVIDSLKLSKNELDMVEHIASQMEEERELDRSAAMADMRYSFIRKLCSETIVKPKESKQHARSRKIDRILTGRFTSLPTFLIIISLVFWMTFDVIGGRLQDVLEDGVYSFASFVNRIFSDLDVNPVIHSLVVDGIIAGIGSVFSFIPIILVLFLSLSLLEDTGYMARIAFVSDKLLRKIGLSGRSIVPLLIGFGCSVPAVMSTRTLSSTHDRRLTILLTPYMSCTAKLPVYAFFAAAFFPKYSAWIMVALYLLGIAVGVLVAIVFKHTRFKSEAAPFVMELPNYRMPSFSNVIQLLWDKTKDFIQRAFTIIFIASIVIWFLQSFDLAFNLVEDSKNSMLAKFANLITPIFSGNGFADWRIVTALIAGFMAKESVVSTLVVLFGSAVSSISMIISPIGTVSLLVFCLLYTPCVAAIAAIKRELGLKWAIFVILIQCAVAWLLSYMVFTIGTQII